MIFIRQFKSTLLTVFVLFKRPQAAFGLFMTIVAVWNVPTCIMLYNTFIEGIT